VTPRRRDGDSLLVRIERRLKSVFGPAQIGRSDEPPPARPTGPATCPACGRPMSEHVVTRSSGRNRIRCP
jgi:hypothetical protein